MLLRPLFRLVYLALLVAAGSAKSQAQSPGETSLGKLRDVARPLLIFAPRADDAHLTEQLRTLAAHAAEVKDRDIVAISIPLEGAAVTPMTLGPAAAAAARSRFHVAAGEFRVVLLGRDGGEKLHAAHPLNMEQLKSTIDAMPMRRNEMHSKPI